MLQNVIYLSNGNRYIPFEWTKFGKHPTQKCVSLQDPLKRKGKVSLWKGIFSPCKQIPCTHACDLSAVIVIVQFSVGLLHKILSRWNFRRSEPAYVNQSDWFFLWEVVASWNAVSKCLCLLCFSSEICFVVWPKYKGEAEFLPFLGSFPF